MLKNKYMYMICLLTENCYGDFVEGKLVEGDGMPVCADFTYAVQFEDTDKAHEFALNNKLEPGDYAIHGYYVTVRD